MRPSALIAEDEYLMAVELGDVLSRLGFAEIEYAATEVDAVRKYLKGRPPLVILDM
jgi:AmiR/NasT family two-component response regulator